VLGLNLAQQDQLERMASVVDWTIHSSNDYRLKIYDAAFAHLASFPWLGLSEIETARLADELTGGVYRHFAEGQVVFDSDFVWISFLGAVPGVLLYILILALVARRAISLGDHGDGSLIVFAIVFFIWSAMDNLLLIQTGWQLLAILSGAGYAATLHANRREFAGPHSKRTPNR
jgi:hypothetical protein